MTNKTKKITLLLFFFRFSFFSFTSDRTLCSGLVHPTTTCSRSTSTIAGHTPSASSRSAHVRGKTVHDRLGLSVHFALDVYGTQQCVVSDNNLVVTSRCVCVCVCVCFLPIHSGHPSSLDVPAGVTNTGGRSHRIYHPLSFCGACLSFFSREGFSHSFPSSTVKSNFVY